jgi:hypothetical protein
MCLGLLGGNIALRGGGLTLKALVMVIWSNQIIMVQSDLPEFFGSATFRAHPLSG